MFIFVTFLLLTFRAILGQVRSCKMMTGLLRFHYVKNLFQERYVSYRSQSTVNVQLLIEWYSISYKFVLKYVLKQVTSYITLDQTRSP